MRPYLRHLFAAVVLCLVVPATARPGDDVAARKSRQGKLSSELARIAESAERGERVKSASRAYDAKTDKVTAVAEVARGGSAQAVADAIKAAGGRVDGIAGNLVKFTIAPTALRDLAARRDVQVIREPFRPTPYKAASGQHSSEVISQGVAVMHADAYRSRTGADGSGVRVAVLDGGFGGAPSLVNTELPGDTELTPSAEQNVGSSAGIHGTACAEIVHDVAPGARMILATFGDEVEWATKVDDLVNNFHPNVISHSIGFDNLFPPDGNNMFARKVDDVAARGVLFVTAAGNEGDKYFQGQWADTNGNDFLEFGGSTELLPFFAAASGTSVVLRWDDPFGSSSHDYDLYAVTRDFLSNPALSSDNPAIIAASEDDQLSTRTPRERMFVKSDSDQILYLVVHHDARTPANAAQRFYLWASNGIDPSLANGSGTLSMPGDSRGAVTVGAVAFDSQQVEGYSSRGPTSDGRAKPDVAGPDKVSTATYGGEFPGTSAATPHVAGAAALILSKNASMNAAALRQALERASTSGGSGKNNDTGFGLIDLNKAP
jgi:subtilisin family serine protease